MVAREKEKNTTQGKSGGSETWPVTGVCVVRFLLSGSCARVEEGKFERLDCGGMMEEATELIIISKGLARLLTDWHGCPLCWVTGSDEDQCHGSFHSNPTDGGLGA